MNEILYVENSLLILKSRKWLARIGYFCGSVNRLGDRCL